MAIYVSSDSVKHYYYPKIMKHREAGFLVLFSSDSAGTVLSYGHANLKVGDNTKHFIQEEFDDYHGKLTLENE